MTGQVKNILHLTEYKPTPLPENTITHSLGKMIWRNYGSQIAVEFPTPKTDNQWLLTSQGWIGFIPCSPEFGISMKPKTDLQNIFGMLEYAYKIKIRPQRGRY